MNYFINDTLEEIDFAPSTIAKEVLQNVKTIISTTKFSVPLDRDFGIDGSLLDLPFPVAQAKISNEIVLAVRRYEPRAKIEGVEITGDMDGKLSARVEVSIDES